MNLLGPVVGSLGSLGTATSRGVLFGGFPKVAISASN